MTKKSSFYAVAITVATGPFAMVMAKLRAVFDKHVPEGYQDENGFHFGSEPHS